MPLLFLPLRPPAVSPLLGRRTFATRAAKRGADEKMLCALLRHETDDQPYEYIDADLAGIRKTLESMYSLDEFETDTEVA